MAIWTSNVDLTWSGASGSPGVNTWYFRTPDDIVNSTGLAEAVSALEAFYEGFISCYPAGVVLSHSGEWRTVSLEEEEVDTFGTPWSINGTGSSGFTEPGLCLTLQVRAKSGGRSGRGRKFLGPLAQGVVQDNGTPVEDRRGDVVASFNENIVGRFDEPADGAFVIWSRKDRVARDMVAGSCANVFAHLRSRRD